MALPDCIHDALIDLTDDAHGWSYSGARELLDALEDVAISEWSESDYEAFDAWRADEDRAMAVCTEWAEVLRTAG